MQAGARRYPEPPISGQHLDKPGKEADLELEPLFDAPHYAAGGIAVSVFAAIGDVLRPKTFAAHGDIQARRWLCCDRGPLDDHQCNRTWRLQPCQLPAYETLFTVHSALPEFIRCESQQILLDVDASLDQVFFPNRGVISLVAVYADGNVIEMATIGREGCAGVQAFFGATRSSAGLLVQIPSSAAKMSRATFDRAVKSMPCLRDDLR